MYCQKKIITPCDFRKMSKSHLTVKNITSKTEANIKIQTNDW